MNGTLSGDDDNNFKMCIVNTIFSYFFSSIRCCDQFEKQTNNWISFFLVFSSVSACRFATTHSNIFKWSNVFLFNGNQSKRYKKKTEVRKNMLNDLFRRRRSFSELFKWFLSQLQKRNNQKVINNADNGETNYVIESE